MTTRVHEARLRAGVELEELERRLGKGEAFVFDLDVYEDEVEMTLSLSEVCVLGSALKVTPVELLNAGADDGASISFDDIHRQLTVHLAEARVTLDEFSEKVGWELGPFLADPRAGWDWSVTGLRWICGGLGLDWASALRNLKMGGA